VSDEHQQTGMWPGGCRNPYVFLIEESARICSDAIVGAFMSKTVYVVYGDLNMSPSLDLESLDGTNGFKMVEDEASFADMNLAGGFSVASADVNGDGIRYGVNPIDARPRVTFLLG